MHASPPRPASARARRRVWWLRGLVGCLAAVALVALLSSTPRRPHHALVSTPQSRPTVLATGTTQPQTALSTGPRQAPAHTKSRELPTCNPGLIYQLSFPTVCSLGVALAITFLGGQALQQDFWVGSSQLLALVLFHHSPKLVLTSAISQLPQLEWLYIQDSVTPEVPTQIGLLTNLRFLSVWEDMVAFPSHVGLLTNLARLEFVEHPSFVQIPTELGLLTKLTLLHGMFNELVGSIPSQIGRLSELWKVSFSHNNLQGPVPSQLMLLRQLNTLHLMGNRLSGTIHSEFGTLGSLTDLRLHSNRLSGTLPSELGNLSDLASLYVHNNRLSGTLPSQLGRLTNLQVLSLAGNDFSGTVPSQFALLSGLYELNLYNTLLSGTIPLSSSVSVRCWGTLLEDPRCPSPSPSPLPHDSRVSDAALWPVYGLAMAVLGLIACTAAFVLVHRNAPVIRITHPMLSLLVLLGLAMATAMIFPYGVTMGDGADHERDAACVVALHLGSQGVALVLCCIGVRNYPIWRIFIRNSLLKRLHITPAALFRPVAASALVMLCLALPVSLRIKARTHSFGCTVEGLEWLLYTVYGYVGALVLVATYMSFIIRRVPSKYNDTQNIGKATYMAATFGTALVCISVGTSEPDPKFLALSLCIALSVLTFVLVVYAPKVVLVRTQRNLHPATTIASDTRQEGL